MDILESTFSEQFAELFVCVSFICQCVTGYFPGFGINNEKPFRCRLPLGIPEALAQTQMRAIRKQAAAFATGVPGSSGQTALLNRAKPLRFK